MPRRNLVAWLLRRLARVVLLVLGAFALPAIGRAQPAAFSDVTPSIMSDPNWLGEGVAWGDYDADGRLDLLVSNEGNLLELFHNEGGGAFTRVTNPVFNTPRNHTGVAWGDYDNDGRVDLYAAESFRPHHLFHNDGGGLFHDVTYVGSLYDTVHTHGVSWADYDGDGDIDLFYATADADGDRLWRNDGGNLFTDVTPPVLFDPQYGRGCSWADIDADGDPDLCVANFGVSRLFRNDGGGAFTDITPPALGQPGQGGGVAWGDYDNDGDFDLYLGVAFGHTSRLLRNDGGGVFTGVTPALLAPVADIVGVQWADFDNDGDLDLFAGNQYGPSFLFRNEGGGTFSDATNPVLADSVGAIGLSWGDYDGDGDLDLFVTHRGQPDHLLRNDLANGNHWLQLDLVGTQSNRSAIGARVELLAGGLRQTRFVDGGGGYNSQNALRLHFGLAGQTQVDSMRIHWPSGIMLDTTRVAADQVLRIVERNPLLAVPGGAAPSLRLDAPVPNPAGSRMVFRYELAAESPVTLRVVDVSGRTTSLLEREASLSAGPHECAWDGRDGAGRRVAPGVYFVRLETASAVLHRKFVRVE